MASPPSSNPRNSFPSRPVTAASRTHIPSLTSSNFFRPLSAQRLQAQRAQAHRPTSTLGQASVREDQSEHQQQDEPPQRPRPAQLETPTITTMMPQPLPSPGAKSHRSGHTRLPSDSQPSAPPTTAGGDAVREEINKEPAQQRKAGSKPSKNYKHFPGNDIFFLGGRFLNTKDKPINVGTAVVIIVPAVLFYVFSAAYLWDHVSKAIPIVFGWLLFVCLSAFVRASATDPGFLPRNLHPFPPPSPQEDPLTIGPSRIAWIKVKSPLSASGVMECPVKYCDTCRIWRPPRAHHCRTCNSCIEAQDHHCIYLNNCIGRRNYQFFTTFITVGVILSLFLSLASLGHMLHWASNHNSSFGGSIQNLPGPFAMFIYGFIFGLYPLSLFIYHIYLIACGQTTREKLAASKLPKNERFRPFSLKHAWDNWFVSFSRPRPPGYIDFRAPYIEGDIRFATEEEAARLNKKEGEWIEMR